MRRRLFVGGPLRDRFTDRLPERVAERVADRYDRFTDRLAERLANPPAVAAHVLRRGAKRGRDGDQLRRLVRRAVLRQYPCAACLLLFGLL